MGSEVVLEDRKVRHGRVRHLREVIVGELGRDEVAAPEVVLASAAALVHLFLDVAHGAVHGERHAVARDDGVVDDVRVRELLVHHVQGFDGLEFCFPRTACEKKLRMVERPQHAPGSAKYACWVLPRYIPCALPDVGRALDSSGPVCADLRKKPDSS